MVEKGCPSNPGVALLLYIRTLLATLQCRPKITLVHCINTVGCCLGFVQEPKMRGISLLLCCLLLKAPAVFAASPFMPDTGKGALVRYATELRGHLRVMSIALRPAEEDGKLLGYLRIDRGATLKSVYISNGEAGEDVRQDMFPFDLAVTRRIEAARVMDMLQAEAVFMNLNDPTGCVTPADLNALWNPDSLQRRLKYVIASSQPDVIILASDKGGGENSPAAIVLHKLLTKLCTSGSWRVSALLVEGSNGERIERQIPKNAYGGVSDSIAVCYASQAGHHSASKQSGVYSVGFSAGKKSMFRDVLRQPAGRIPGNLTSIAQQVERLARQIVSDKKNPIERVGLIVPLLHRVDSVLIHGAPVASLERRIVLDWKEGLENLRSAVLGVDVKCSLEYDVLCERQLVRLAINRLDARVSSGTTEFYFPETTRGWILNETPQNRIPVKEGDTLRLISPQQIDYDLPFAQQVSVRSTIGHLLSALIVHTGKKPENSFVYRLHLKVYYSPRFTTEVLTPIVRKTVGESIVVRMTNHSRDGLADSLTVSDSAAASTTAYARFEEKETIVVDTLRLTSIESSVVGSTVLGISLGGVPVARVFARTVSCEAAPATVVGLVSGKRTPAVESALRRIEVADVIDLSSGVLDSTVLSHVHAVVVDRRAVTLRGLHRGEVEALHEFVRRGGNLIILSQDAEGWKECGLWDKIHIESSVGLSRGSSVMIDSLSDILFRPNRIGSTDFAQWLQRWNYSDVSIAGNEGTIQTPIRTPGGKPLMCTAIEGRGRISYVDLALGTQWMNVSGGALRLLGNLIAMRRER